MKAESTALAEQRETTEREIDRERERERERERADTEFEFSLWFSVVLLTYLFSGFVSIAARLV